MPDLANLSAVSLLVWIMGIVISVLATVLCFLMVRFVNSSDKKFTAIFRALGIHQVDIATLKEKGHHQEISIVRLQKKVEAL